MLVPLHFESFHVDRIDLQSQAEIPDEYRILFGRNKMKVGSSYQEIIQEHF